MSDNLAVSIIENLPDFKPGDDVAQAIVTSLEAQQKCLEDGDILVIAHKIVSKSEGAMVRLADVTPGPEALALAEETAKDPRKVEVILQQSSKIVRAIKRPEQQEGLIIAEHKLGFISANAAVDESNAEPGYLITLPENPDHSAARIGQDLSKHFGCRIGIVISDTFGRPWRMGQVNVAIGLYQVPALDNLAGHQDAWGHELKVTMPAFADELAAASGLLMKKDGKCPVIQFRGLAWQATDSQASHLLRASREDLFR